MLSATATRRRQRGPATSHTAQRLVAALVALLALVSLILGLRLGVAALKDYQASSFLSSWERQRTIPSEQAWQVGLSAARQAQAWFPGSNAQLTERLGYFWQWRAHQLGAQGAGATPALAEAKQQAIQQFREAIKLRPQWPFAWLGLAYAKLVANQLDSEFEQALILAQQYAPERNPVNARVAEIGLIAWSHLSPAQQQRVMLSIVKTHRYSPSSRKALLDLAAELQHLSWLCVELSEQQGPCAAFKGAQ